MARLPRSESARLGRRQDVDLSQIINDGIAGFVDDRCLPNPHNYIVSTDLWEVMGELVSRGFGAVRHKRNADGGH